MAVTGYLYDAFPQACMKKLVSDMSDAASVIKVALCTSTYTPSQASHSTYNDITDELTVASTGYTVGGKALSTKTLVTATRVTTFDADDIAWPNSTFTCRYAILYDDTPSGATNKRLIGYIDFGVNYSTVAATFQLVWNTSGILTWTVA
jgi:hypothetical protein